MKKKTKDNISLTVAIDKIVNENLENILGDRYAAYAKDVIQDRAIPDARDGLKPVQRRIIFGMYKDRIFQKKKRIKCAKVVGQVMGNYHPHGDSSIYEALVRMGQDWVMRVPLIDFQGNNGSIDGDSAAAMRYTEARLCAISEQLTLDLEKRTVDMQFTYDDSKLEPMVLPARFPNLLVNGSSGIGVGFATQIPPHNFHEVIEATIYKIQHPNAKLEKLREFVLGPDFPTGGTIYQCAGLDSIYENGVGRVDICSKYEILKTKTNHQIIITEIPYGLKKQDMVVEMEKLARAKTIDGMLEVRDESDGPNIRVVIDLKDDAKSDLIVNYLIKNRLVMGAFNANMVCIVDGRPKTLGLIDALNAFINHQIDVIRRRSTYDLLKNQERLHIVNGIIVAIINIDEVVRIIRASKTKLESKEKLIARFKISEKQAEAILMMPLYRLNNTDVLEFETEKSRLEGEIKNLNEILSNEDSLNKLIISDLRELNKTYISPRKTVIEGTLEVKAVDERDLIAKEEVMLNLTRDGYVKRSSMKSYVSSGDNALPGVKSEDIIIYCGQLKTTDYLLAFTSLGNYLHIPVHLIQEGKWKDEGKHINYLVTLASDEKIVKAINVSTFRPDLFIGLVSARGQIKKTSVQEFSASRYAKPINCMRLMPGDSLVDAHVLHGNDDLIIIASDGRATFYNENEVTPLGIRAGGIKTINNLRDANIVGFYPYNKNEKSKMLILTDMGYYKIFEPHQLEITKRLGKVQDAVRTFKSDPHKVIYIQKISNEEKDSSYKTHILTKEKNIFVLELTEFYLFPIDKYAKTNIEGFDKKDPFISAYSRDTEWIGKSTKSEFTGTLPPIVEEEKPLSAPTAQEKAVIKESATKDKKSDKYEEFSIFDLMGD